MAVKFVYDGRNYYAPDSMDGVAALQWATENVNEDLSYMIIDGLTLKNTGFFHCFTNTSFENCVFIDAHLGLCKFLRCTFVSCEIKGDTSWLDKDGVTISSSCTVYREEIKLPTNEEIASQIKGQVYSLPNKEFVKIKATCDFCHKDFYQIMHRGNIRKFLRPVPNCDKQVCESCYRFYDISHKEQGNRTYGYHGPLSFFRTPMDKRNTAILGLEMEFEGDFYGWKELQDAHQGNLHFGYDSSVRGENELSWDCGSYSWWKYLAPLKNVCDVLKKFGGTEGDTAGIHIHVSRPDINVESVTQTLNTYCRDGVFNILMRAVSLRNNLERFNMYANLSANMSQHHAAISYNSHGTCEFRVFNSSLDSKLILHHMKFCKELFNQVAEGTTKDSILRAFSKETKKHILECAETQAQKGFITLEERDELLGNLK